MNQKVKAGVIGLGRLGKEYSILLQHHVKHIDLLAACSLNQQELAFAKDKLGVQYTYTDHKQIVQNHDIDAIFIFSPPAHHAGQIIDSIEAGKHVFIATPLAINVEDCNKVIKSAKARPSQVTMIGFEHRYDPAYIHAKEYIKKGRIGQPILVESSTYEKEKTITYYQQYASQASGIFMELNIKNIDIIRWLTESEFDSVYSLGKTFKHDIFNQLRDAESAMSMLTMNDGCMANIQASRVAQDGFNLKTSIFGSEGSIEILQNSPMESILIHDTNGRKVALPQTYFERYRSALQAQANDFVECILESKKPRTNLLDGLEATRTVVAMTKSFLMGDKISINREG